MKQGKESIQALATEVIRQAKTKKDFIAPTSKVTMLPHQTTETDRHTVINIQDQGYFGITDTAHENIAQHTGIYKKYYDKMRVEAPDLLATNVNHWFGTNPEARMLRTLDGNMRAMLSPRYRILDNFDMMGVIVQEVQNYGGELVLASSEVTERKLYMKFIYPNMQAAVRVGDIHSAGVIVSNSEIGYGRVRVDPFLFRLKCTNGMIAAEAGLRKNHVGRQLDELEGAYELFTDETRQQDDRAFFMKVRDVFRATLAGDIFEQQIELLKGATEKKITGNVEGAVQVLSNKYLFSEDERTNVLQHLIEEGDLSMFGLANAVTRTAEDLSSYDRATHFEKVGGEVITLAPSEWKVISEANKPEEKKRGRKAKAA